MPSAVVKSFKYDPERCELRIIFQTRRCYTYKEVPAETYDSMKAAFSKAEFISTSGISLIFCATQISRSPNALRI